MKEEEETTINGTESNQLTETNNNLPSAKTKVADAGKTDSATSGDAEATTNTADASPTDADADTVPPTNADIIVTPEKVSLGDCIGTYVSTCDVFW